MRNIKDISENLRPREKALRLGLSALNDVELLALIIGSGSAHFSVLDISEEILKTYKSLANFSLENYYGISKIKGLKKSKSLLLLAMFEFHKRVSKENASNSESFTSSFDIYQKYYHLSMESQEVLLLIILNKKDKIIKEIELYRGTSSSIEVSIKEIISEILIGKGSSFVIIHNHPSDNYLPSQDDIISTELLKRKSADLDIKFKDHIIITKEGYYSFKDNEKVLT